MIPTLFYNKFLVAFSRTINKGFKGYGVLKKMTIKVQLINAEKRFGIVADSDFDSDAVIFNENPIVSSQFLYNKDFFPACSYCLRSLESPDEMLRRLSGSSATPSLPFLDEYSHLKGTFTTCDSCNETYCNEECLKNAWNDHHRILCVGRCSPNKAKALLDINDFWKSFHFPPETCSITLALRVVAYIITRLDNGLTTEEAKSEFSHFVCDFTRGGKIN